MKLLGSKWLTLQSLFQHFLRISYLHKPIDQYPYPDPEPDEPFETLKKKLEAAVIDKS